MLLRIPYKCINYAELNINFIENYIDHRIVESKCSDRCGSEDIK